MKRKSILTILLAVMTLTMSFAGIPENPGPKDHAAVVKANKAAFIKVENAGTSLAFYKNAKAIPPQQIVVAEGVQVPCPSGGPCYCWGDVTSYQYWHPLFGWQTYYQTTTNLHVYCFG
jgi:hypothetical protein